MGGRARPLPVASLALLASCAAPGPRARPPVAEGPRAAEPSPPPRAPSPPARDAGGALAACTATVLEARLVDGCLEIPVSIGGRTGWMVADTGATYSAVARRFVAGLPSRPLRGGEVELADLRLGDLVFERVHLVPRDGSPRDGERVGAIGTDFLSQYVVVLDWEASKVAFVQRSHAEACTGGWTFPYVDVLHYGPEPRRSGPPLVPVVRLEATSEQGAEPLAFDAQLDSGSCETEPRPLLHANRALAATLRAGLGLRPAKVVRFLKGETGLAVKTTFFAPSSAAAVRVGAASLGPFFVVEHPPESRGPYASAGPLAVLGSTAMRALGTLAVDPFRRRLWSLGSARSTFP